MPRLAGHSCLRMGVFRRVDNAMTSVSPTVDWPLFCYCFIDSQVANWAATMYAYTQKPQAENKQYKYRTNATSSASILRRIMWYRATSNAIRSPIWYDARLNSSASWRVQCTSQISASGAGRHHRQASLEVSLSRHSCLGYIYLHDSIGS